MTLSNRALEAEEGSKGMVIWDVITNLWDQSNPDGIVSLGVAENTLMHNVLKKHIHDNIALSNLAFTYGDGTTGTKRAKQAVARFLTRQLKPFRAIEPAHISMTNGCSAAIEHLSWAIADPGDAILLGQPYYGTFIPDLTCRFGAKLLSVPFNEVDPLGDDAVAKYEEVIVDAQKKGLKVKGLVISHPHNPLGRCYSRNVLIGLMKLCQKYQVHFISDEIYALSTWPNTVDTNPPPVPFESALTIDTTGVIDPSLVHVLWGMSKDFGANGIRVGALISQANPSLHTALVAVGLYSSVSSISDHVTINLLEDDAFVESYMAENRKKLAAQYERAVSWAKKNDITYAPGVNAAFFLWVDLGKAYRARHTVDDGKDITGLVMKKLLEKKVFLASGEAFGSEKPGWFRIVFSHPDEYLDMGLERVVEALQ
ncbi:Aminotran-1-2 domain-containing protein [Fusarium keratoplasticum]|uniref:Aminotran-1-2 domain-containing protein n=1 Tax=Fusarium keratoplasticum TaxID=1328300 RepID=A0ACC0QM14_9HYPO|nr:Aminotran-1-2 domain-containing protein [Fusarium keratoplasticum]KAI8657848.1 Aminotran-1-2 domain-containing protein [Fusarium keratoplasticum]